MSKINVPIVKGKQALEIELDELPEDVYREMCIQGMKVLLNRGMSKLTKDTEGAPEEAMKIAAENWEKCKEGKIRFTSGASKDKVSGAVKTEAMRLARNIVKDELKRNQIKVSHVAASDITAAAKELLEGESGPELIEKAKKALADREATPVKINLASIPIDPKKVEASEKKKAAAKAKKGEPLSATQAGIPAKRKGQKGQPAETAH